MKNTTTVDFFTPYESISYDYYDLMIPVYSNGNSSSDDPAKSAATCTVRISAII